MSEVIGVDFSLTCTAIHTAAGVRFIRTKPADFENKLERLHHIAVLFAHALPADPGVAYVEGYAFNVSQNAHGLGEVGGQLLMVLWLRGWQVVIVPPSTLKKFATGKGNTPKDGMRMHIQKRWDYESYDNNDADAFALRMLGLIHQAWKRSEPASKAAIECFAKIEIFNPRKEAA